MESCFTIAPCGAPLCQHALASKGPYFIWNIKTDNKMKAPICVVLHVPYLFSLAWWGNISHCRCSPGAGSGPERLRTWLGHEAL